MPEGWERICSIVEAAAPVEPPVIARECEKSGAKKASRRDRAVKQREEKSLAGPTDAAACADGMADPVAADSISRGQTAAADQPAVADDDNMLAFPAGKRRGGKKKPADDAGAAAEGGEAEPPKPKTFGFSVGDLNGEFALVLMGSKAVVFLEQPAATIEDRKRVLSLDAFKAWFANKFTQRLAAGGEIKTVTWATAWLQSKERRSYRGIEFFPDRDNAPGMAGYLNLWSGFAIAPAPKPDALRYKTFRDHLLNNVCHGDDGLFAWTFGFIAHMVQKPRERIGVALVLRGRMGTGKTKVGEVVGRLWPRHYFLVDDPRYVTGQFNAHMATCLLLQADEAVWAGDKAAAGRLKGLITSPIQQIEAKGIDPIRLPNYVRLILTSNEDWVVPAGPDERRFAVLDVDPRCMQNHGYFREMDAELDDGGLAHLLGDLLAFDLDSVNLRKIPRTAALLEQKIRSLDSVESWWYGRLRSGTTTRRGDKWERVIACSNLFDDYIATSEKIGVHRKQEETVFGIKLARLIPGLDRRKRVVSVDDEHGVGGVVKRVWCYLLPPLGEARSAFESIVNQDVNWPAEEAAEVDSLARENDEVKF